MANTKKALEIKRASKRSFRNLRDAARELQGKGHEGFGTSKVRLASLSYVRTISREANMTLGQVERWADEKIRNG